MPKPSEAIMAWVEGLAPSDELAVRMALNLTNPWCSDDNGWQHRIGELRAKLIKSDDDEKRYRERAAEMARDMNSAIQSMMAQPPDSLDR
jgi:hypothetical protein